MHHLGFAWRDGRLGKPATLIVCSGLAVLVLAVLILWGPYPLAMAGSPGEAVSNTLPPKITLIALGIFQFGLLLAIEKPMQRLLNGKRLWTSTVIINTMIMTIYLWHMTVLVIVLGLGYLSGGFGFMFDPGSTAWWLTRPVWLAVLLILLLPVALLFSPLERQTRDKDLPVPGKMRLLGGAAAAGLGIALLTLYGFDGNPFTGIHILSLALVVGGALVCGLRIKIS